MLDDELPDELRDEDLDFEDDADVDADDWDEETLGFEEVDTDTLAREIGVRS